jgi:gliding motility-associated-like protein
MQNSRTQYSFIIFTLLSFFSLSVKGQLLFTESFGEVIGSTDGVDDLSGVPWSSSCPDCIDEGDYFNVQSGKLVGQDTNGPATWESESIDISTCDFFSINFDLQEEGTMEGCGTGCNSVDYVMLEFNIDGTGWQTPDNAFFCEGECADVFVIQSDDIDGVIFNYSSGCIAGGDNLQVRITVQAWASSERWLIDNISIACAEGPEINAGEDQIICEGTEITLVADNPDGAVIDWDNDVEDGISFVPSEGVVTYTVSAELGECTSFDEVVITVLPATSVSIDGAGPFNIESGTHTLVASPGGGTWSADCGACINPITGVFDPLIAGVGTWEICYLAGTPPCDDEACINISVTEGCDLNGTISFNNPTCNGFSDGSATLFTTGGMGDLNFVITNDDGIVVNEDNSNTANGLGEGWYYFSVTDETPCTYIDSIFIAEPEALIIDLTLIQPDCYGIPSGSAIVDTVINYGGSYSEISYVWSPNPTGLNGLGEDELSDIGEGMYNLTLTDDNGCALSIDFEIAYPDSLYLNEFEKESAYCRVFDYQSGNGVLFASALGGTPGYTYEWLNIETLETQNNTTWGGLNPGNYQLTVIDAKGCELIQTIYLDSLNPIASFEMTSPQFITEWEGTSVMDVHFINTSQNYSNPNSPSGQPNFFWNFGFGESILTHDILEEYDQSYTSKGVYEICLTVDNKNGCKDSVCKTIIVFEPFKFEPVNVFSPNQDGVNDLFTFENYAKSVKSFKCIIVNRWGNEIAQLNTITEVWDGTTPDGNVAVEGVYFYTYSGQTYSGEAFQGQGTIQLFRGK